MRILLIEPFFTGSHKSWAEEYARFSEHEVEILSLNGHYWKWRMHGGAVSLARKYMESDLQADLLLTTDMLDLTTFLALTRKRTASIPTALYFHENQLAYPWSGRDPDVKMKRDNHYAFINYASALAADKVLFNSVYNKDSFLKALPPFLNAFPDHHEKGSVKVIEQKSEVLPLGMDLNRFDAFRETAPKGEKPLILWNHRWEHDKDPDSFFQALQILDQKGLEFEVAVLGQEFAETPQPFERARKAFGDKIVQWGYVESFEEYAGWLWKADILPVTSKQDFFGGSLVQAMYCNCRPILPNRLAFPEHIPPPFRYPFYYNYPEQLTERLQWAIEHLTTVRQSIYRPWVEGYDWSRMAPRYDDLFTSFL